MFKRHVLKKLSAYLDSQLSEKEKFNVEKHISECDICSQELARLKLVSDKLKEVKVPDLHEDFDSSVRDEILRRELEGGRVEMDKKPLAILIPSGVIAGILVMLVVGVNMQKFVKRGVRGGINEAAGRERYSGDYRYRDEKVRLKGGAQISRETDEFILGKDSFYDAQNSLYGERISRAAPTSRDLAVSFGGVGGGRIYNGPDEGNLRHKLNKYVLDDVEEVEHVSFSERTEYAYEPSDISAITSSRIVPAEKPLPQGSVIVIQPVLPATGEEDMIIRTGYINLEVESGKDTHSKASKICQELGGYISNSNFYKDKEGRETGTITMRIPRAVFDAALDKLSALGKIEGMNTNSRDASQEYANLKAQLDAKLVVYDKMLEALNRRKVSIPEAIRLESQLTPVAREIEQLKNRIEYLNNQVAFTTVTLNFHEPKVSTKALKESKKIVKETAISATINAVKFLAAAIPVVVVIGFWGIIIVVVVLVIKHWILRLFKRD